MSIFNRNKENIQQQENIQPQIQNSPESVQDYPTSRPEIKQEDFVDMSDPNTNPGSASEVASTPQEKGESYFDWGLNMPIDNVYKYMETNWENEGRKDAIENPDISHMQSKVEIIKQGLKRRFDLTSLKYNKMIRGYNAQIVQLSTFGLTGAMRELESHIETCQEHLEKLKELEQKYQNNDSTLASMVASYERGFANGVALRTRSEIENNNR